MPGELTTQKVRDILAGGRVIRDEDWVRHTRDHSLRTVYHMCGALRVSPGRVMSFRELHDIFRENLRASGLPSPPDGFNPVDHISALWTICETSIETKLEGDFIPEITELLARTPENRKPNSKFNYQIRFKYYDTVTKVLDELNGVADNDSDIKGVATSDSSIAGTSSLAATQTHGDFDVFQQNRQSSALFEPESPHFSEKEVEYAAPTLETVDQLHEYLLLAVAESAKLSAEERAERLAQAASSPKRVKLSTYAFIRNPDVMVEVLNRAKGVCEHCGNPAPFQRARDGSPYLEVHHIRPLSAGGEDITSNALALCPNCHRYLHFGEKGPDLIVMPKNGLTYA